jgi:hypothetical protein
VTILTIRMINGDTHSVETEHDTPAAWVRHVAQGMEWITIAPNIVIRPAAISSVIYGGRQ